MKRLDNIIGDFLFALAIIAVVGLWIFAFYWASELIIVESVDMIEPVVREFTG